MKIFGLQNMANAMAFCGVWWSKPRGFREKPRGGRSLNHLALYLRRSTVSGFPLSTLSFDVGNKTPGGASRDSTGLGALEEGLISS